MVKAYLCGEQRDWDLHLGCLDGAFRATPNESTKLSLNLLTIGRELCVPAELVFSSKNTCDGLEITSYGEYVDQLRQKMQYAHEVARKHLWIFYVFVLSCVCYVLCASVYMCFVVTCWDLLALVCGVYCEFVTFPLVSLVRCGTLLYRFLIFASLLTLLSQAQ